ncbi:hypothetical protein SO694_00020117 [Aureococcus anophagefferens]|uniref:Cytosolic carboxypeptidase N-terminal domain-containing protein n=1 Tax=Aureococcus anophagefferens TaxID=44056 RepID=A0ABR1FU51_AURAN
MASANLPLVSCAFDGGNIVQKGVLPLDGGAVQLRLAIKPDVYTNGTDKTAHAQWFYFKVSRCKGACARAAIEDIEAALVPREERDLRDGRGPRGGAAPPHARDSFTEVDDDAATVAGDASFLPLARYNSDARTFAKPPLPPVPEVAVTADATPDFQHAPGVEGRGYEPTPPGEANLSVCTNAIATRYGCLAVTLEQPFKDSTFHTPEPVCGWSGPRALKLGAALVHAPLGPLALASQHRPYLRSMAAASFAPLTVPVGGLSCEGCVRSARSAILGVEGVVWCEGPDLAKPVALVHATRSVGHEEVALALESVGLSAHPEGRETLASLLEALARWPPGRRGPRRGPLRSGALVGPDPLASRAARARAVAVVAARAIRGLRRAGLAPAPPLRPRTSLACRTTFETSGSAFASTFEGHADAESAVADLAAKCGVTSRRGLRTHWWRMLCGGLARFETADAYDAAAVACGRAVDDARLPDRVDGPAPGDLKREAAAAIHALGAIRQTRGDLDGALAAYADAHEMAPLDARYASAYADALAGNTAAAMIRNDAYAAAHRMHALGRLCAHNAVCAAIANARALELGPVEGEPPFDLVARRKDLDKAGAAYAALLKLADVSQLKADQLAAARTQHHWLKIALDPFGGNGVLASLGRSEPRLGPGLR